jgi:tetratricopeptide (TPR) repeat protein
MHRTDEIMALGMMEYGMAHHDLSLCYVEKGKALLGNKSKLNDAIDLFQKALAEENGNANAYAALGTAYKLLAEQTRDPEYQRRATESFQIALRIDPENKAARIGLTPSSPPDGRSCSK